MRLKKWNRPQKEIVNKSVDVFSDGLNGKIVGFIGYGAIGRKIRKFLEPFNFKFPKT